MIPTLSPCQRKIRKPRTMQGLHRFTRSCAQIPRSTKTARRPERLDLDIERREAFCNHPDVIAQAFGRDVEMTPDLVGNLTHFSPQGHLEATHVHAKGFDRLGDFGIHDSRQTDPTIVIMRAPCHLSTNVSRLVDVEGIVEK